MKIKLLSVKVIYKLNLRSAILPKNDAMSTIQRITNSDKNIEEKVNYFLDQITHATSYIGWQWSLDLESPVALLEKILFRLEHDTKIRLQYTDNYFKHAFFAETFWEKYRNYAEVKTIVNSYNVLSKNQHKEKIQLLSDVNFQKNLKLLYRDLQHKMFRDIMDTVYSHVQCLHKLDEPVPGVTETHAAALKSAAQTLVATYIFKGYTRNEITQIISRVFSKDEYAFPFPKHIKTKTQRKKHLAEGDLKNQLHGFTNAFEEETGEGRIIVKIFGGYFPDNFKFKYNTVSFYSKDHPYIQGIKQKMKPDQQDDFFVPGEYILASATISWHSQYSLLENIRKQIRSELPYLSSTLDRNFSVDTTSNYIQLTTGGRYQGMAWSSQKFDDKLSDRKLEQLNDNVYHNLRKYKGIAAEWFLSHEQLFVQACIKHAVADYWLYLEVLLSQNRLEKQVISTVSKIILSNEKFVRDKRILTTIRDAFLFFSNGYALLQNPKSKAGFQRARSAIKNGKIASAVRKLKYPFIVDMVNEFDSQLDKDHYKNAEIYYRGILTEAYEYRNFAVHSGKDTQAAREKLLATLPNIILRLRWAILKALRNGDHDTPFDLLIEKLVKESEHYFYT